MMNDVTLLEPYTLHDLVLQNRVVMAPLTRSRSGKQRIPNDLMAKYYSQRASAGLIISEATSISVQGLGMSDTPGIYTDPMVEGWKKITRAIHAKGGAVFMQLWHCGRVSHSSFHHGELSVAPSAIKLDTEFTHTPNGKEPTETPRALAVDEIPGVIEDYRFAAERAKQAGFDGVEIHSANGYLLDQFLQSKANERTDGYGGSLRNRYRLLDEVVQAVLSVWPSHRVGVRISPNGVFNDMGSPDFREQFTYAARQLDQLDLAYLHVMDGLDFGFHGLGDPMTLNDFRNVFHGPLIGNCGYDQLKAEAAIHNGHADLIAFGRPFISNPDLVERYRNGWAIAPDPDPSARYQSGEEGYTDFPEAKEAS